MLYVASKTRRTLAQQIVSGYGKMAAAVVIWFETMCADGCEYETFQHVWTIFRKDTGLTYAADPTQYNSLYRTLQRVVAAKQERRPAGRKAAKVRTRFNVAKQAKRFTVSQLTRMLAWAEKQAK